MRGVVTSAQPRSLLDRKRPPQEKGAAPRSHVGAVWPTGHRAQGRVTPAMSHAVGSGIRHETTVSDENPARNLVEVRRTSVIAPRLRVLFVTSMWPDRARPHYGPFVASQAQSLEARGIGVDVLAIRGYCSTRAYIDARPRLLRLLREMNPDVVHVHTGHATTIALTRIQVPKVVSFVGGDLLGLPDAHGITSKSRIESLVFRRLAYLFDATITKSAEMERTLSRRLQGRNHVIPNGVDLDHFRPLDHNEARRALGWESPDPVALFMGNPSDPRKNVTLATQAIAELARRGPSVRLHIGWGARPGEVPRLMAAADVLVFPSLSEGSPNVVKEAMACALPVAATPVGDVRERLSGVDGCFIVEPTPTSFANGVERALRSPRAPAAREAVRALALGPVAARIEQVYAAALR
jgi:teichuronic acid biosynthesis glycosyltransferase TuaC